MHAVAYNPATRVYFIHPLEVLYSEWLRTLVIIEWDMNNFAFKSRVTRTVNGIR